MRERGWEEEKKRSDVRSEGENDGEREGMKARGRE